MFRNFFLTRDLQVERAQADRRVPVDRRAPEVQFLVSFSLLLFSSCTDV